MIPTKYGTCKNIGVFRFFHDLILFWEDRRMFKVSDLGLVEVYGLGNHGFYLQS